MNKFGHWKKICCIMLIQIIVVITYGAVPVCGEDEVPEPDNLYARSCVLMDGSTGRVLFEKNGYEKMPMASTTKIMTLIVTLENGNLDDLVTVSAYAAGQPKVHLGMHAGQQFVLRDLCYSLMLESHNDSAAAIAEYIGSKKLNLPEAGERTKEQSKEAVAAFAKMMNEKARDLGCFDTYFITPNGLDASVLLKGGEQRIHSTTAHNLAAILMYCINASAEKDQFLSITQASGHSFQDVAGTISYQCSNHNAFLGMMDGALTGKTGFTNQAGYCYVGALYRDQKLLIVALLACGWPNNRSYKWSDTKKLMEYGLSAYEYEQVYDSEADLEPVPVLNGRAGLGENAYVQPVIEDQQLEVLLKKGESVKIDYDILGTIEAPVQKNDVIGHVTYSIDDKILAKYPVLAGNKINKKTFLWCLKQVGEQFMEKK